MSFRAVPAMLSVIVALLVLWIAPAVRADDAPLTAGGDITVDGHPLQSHFLRQGNNMFFPIVELAKAVGKTADINGNVVTVGVLTAPVTMQDGVAYVDYRGISTLFPDLHFGATATRAVFTTKVATTKPTTPTHGPGTAAPTEIVSVFGQNASEDPNRGNRVTIEANFQNNTTQPLGTLKVILQIIDVNGVTGNKPGTPCLYANYEQALELGPSEIKKLVFETSIGEPQSLDSGAQTMKVLVGGLELNQTAVDLRYEFVIQKPK